MKKAVLEILVVIIILMLIGVLFVILLLTDSMITRGIAFVIFLLFFVDAMGLIINPLAACITKKILSFFEKNSNE